MRKLWRGLSVLLVLTLITQVALAQPGGPNTRLRDELIRHFSQDNLVPVFLPRDQEVGDVLDTRGTVYAKRADCFPLLKLPAPRPTSALQEISIALQAEGNFGLGLKRIVNVFASGGASTETRLSIVFKEQSYISVSTVELKKAYSKEKCPFLESIVGEKAVSVETAKHPLLVLQEVFYAKKQLAINVEKSADIKAELKKVEIAVAPLSPTASLQVRQASGNYIYIDSGRQVPIAVRLAFLPMPITGATLGTGGSAEIRKIFWQASPDGTAAPPKKMTWVFDSIAQDTMGEENPLTIEE